MSNQDLVQIKNLVMECLRAHEAEALRIKYHDLHNQQYERRGNVSREWLVNPASTTRKADDNSLLCDYTEADTTTQEGGV